MPKWNPINLARHHAKHPGDKDKLCWQDLLGVNGRTVSEAEYEKESLVVCRHRWLEYEAEEADKEWVGLAIRRGEGVPYHPRRRYYVDDRLIKTIVEPDGEEIVTCFHEHFGNGHQPSDLLRPVGERRERLNKHLERLEASKQIRHLKRIHDES